MSTRPDSDKDAPRFGRYQVTDQLGKGGMGSVYRARDTTLGRDVAVKTIHAPAGGLQAELFRARFQNEARAVATLSHDNVVQVFDIDVDAEPPFLVMELVEGGSLADRIKSGSLLTSAEAEVLGRQMASALAHAHAAGVIHRDVKPANILEAAPGKWKLADFGIAHVPDSSLTITGQFLGSPAFAAPEALGRGTITEASDVYGLGATLHAALTGQPPFGPDGILSAAALSSAPIPLGRRAPHIAPHLADAIDAATRRSPDQRPTAEQLLQLLAGAPMAVSAPPPRAGHLAPPPADRQRRNRFLGMAGITLLVAVAVGAALAPGSGASRPDSSEPHATPALAPTSVDDALPPGQHRAREKAQQRRNKHWREIEKKLDRGKERDAIRHLRELLDDDPNDAEANALYERLTGSRWKPEARTWDDDD